MHQVTTTGEKWDQLNERFDDAKRLLDLAPLEGSLTEIAIQYAQYHRPRRPRTVSGQAKSLFRACDRIAGAYEDSSCISPDERPSPDIVGDIVETMTKALTIEWVAALGLHPSLADSASISAWLTSWLRLAEAAEVVCAHPRCNGHHAVTVLLPVAFQAASAVLALASGVRRNCPTLDWETKQALDVHYEHLLLAHFRSDIWRANQSTTMDAD